jgi:hypothetical protein
LLLDLHNAKRTVVADWMERLPWIGAAVMFREITEWLKMHE